jgi:UDP-N-acetylmuramate dehydrogenase
VSAHLLVADGSEAQVPATELHLDYRDSRLKHEPDDVVLGATFRLTSADPGTIAARLDEIRRWRREHQPLGIPSAGSVFRNPSGDSAGRLIDEAGLKGYRIGGAVVSDRHANFIVNDRRGTAADIRRLTDHVRTAVAERFAITLQEEILFLGDWDDWPWPVAGA